MGKTIFAVVITYLSLAACVLSAETASKAVTIWYKPGGSWISALPAASGLPPVAVYLFHDSRQSPCGPDCIPTLSPDVGRWGTWPPVRASEPVVLPVTRAFAEGLRARGFPVVDRTRRVFQAGDSTDGAGRGLRGELLSFASVPTPFVPKGSYFESRLGGIVCVVSLEVFDLQSGEKLWEKTYSGTSSIDEASRQGMQLGSEERIQPFLATALAAAIENAAMDPELAEALGRSGS
jgi:hypothetical protein